MIKTHWGRVTHICVGKLAIIGSNNGLSPGRRQAIIWTNAAILLIGPLGTNFSAILNELQTFSLKKILLKMSSAKCCPFRLGLNVLRTFWLWHAQEQLRVNTYRILSSLFYRIGINKMHCYLYKRWKIIFLNSFTNCFIVLQRSTSVSSCVSWQCRWSSQPVCWTSTTTDQTYPLRPGCADWLMAAWHLCFASIAGKVPNAGENPVKTDMIPILKTSPDQ